MFSRSYNGASLRRQAHAFADDIVLAITGKKGIGQTKIAFKSQPSGNGAGEIYVADFDGHNAQRRHARQRDRRQAGVGAGPAGAVLHVLRARQSGHFLPQPVDRPARA